MNNLSINEERLKKMQNILADLQYKDNENFLGKHCEVLIENKLEGQEKYFGRTQYMTPVIFDSEKCNPGETVNVKITSINQKNLFGFYKSNKFIAA